MIKPDILKEIGRENLEKSEAPEALHPELEKKFILDGGRRAIYHANSAFIEGGAFQQTLGSHVDEAKEFFTHNNRETFLAGQAEQALQSSLLEKTQPGLLSKFSVFHHDKSKETEEKQLNQEHTFKPSKGGSK